MHNRVNAMPKGEFRSTALVAGRGIALLKPRRAVVLTGSLLTLLALLAAPGSAQAQRQRSPTS